MNAVHTLFKSSEALRHNVRVKSYPDGWKNVLMSKTALFAEPGWVHADDAQPEDQWPMPEPDLVGSG